MVFIKITILCSPVNKIYWFAEMGSFQAFIPAAFPDRLHMFFDQPVHIHLPFLHVRPQEHPADMGSTAEICFVHMFFSFVCECHMGSYQFCNIIRYQPCPDFLLDIFRFFRMVIT